MKPKTPVIAAAAMVVLAIASHGAASAATQPADAATIAFGRSVAQRFCGQCHGLEAQPSPFAEAPPFADLHLRYRGGGLEALLKEGMLTPDPSMEEGNMPGHPRMPQRRLDIDERAALTAYLRSLEPTKTPERPAPSRRRRP
jgi:mono/diheme cytochrome c family protein